MTVINKKSFKFFGFCLRFPEFSGRKNNAAAGKNEVVGILADIAPTVLELMHVPKPDVMTAQSLVDLLVD